MTSKQFLGLANKANYIATNRKFCLIAYIPKELHLEIIRIINDYHTISCF
jgi:hypothetical protein